MLLRQFSNTPGSVCTRTFSLHTFFLHISTRITHLSFRPWSNATFLVRPCQARLFCIATRIPQLIYPNCHKTSHQNFYDIFLKSYYHLTLYVSSSYLFANSTFQNLDSVKAGSPYGLFFARSQGLEYNRHLVIYVE